MSDVLVRARRHGAVRIGNVTFRLPFLPDDGLIAHSKGPWQAEAYIDAEA